jgi:junctophilin
MASRGIIYEYEDGGKYCGEWENDAAHGHGVCTGPNGNGLFEGLWERGNQSSGIFTWPSGQKYMGKWRQGVRGGTGKETKTDGTEYCGEFTKDSRGPCGVLRQPNGVVYRGTWSEGVQNGEGTELYIDGGVYRGEYLKGLRHGFGTRSSSNYERSTVKDEPATHSTSSSVTESIESLANTLEDPSSNAASISVMMSDKTNAQVYEGEWRDDKRHGYGVLKIVGHHTYYGQWEENMRSGYGVMICGEEKRKEEGQWQRGKLVQPLKRKKLQLKTKQLEMKVNQAHMSALQAAETARSKADLAEGRASTANAKSRQAVRAAQQAIKDAEIAQSIEKLYRNAPKIQEGIRSPVTESYSAGNIAAEAVGSNSSAGQFLQPPSIATSPSFEDLAAIASSMPHTNDDNESNDSFEESRAVASLAPKTHPPNSNHKNPSPEVSRRPTQLTAQIKRDRFHATRHSSADLTLHTKERADSGMQQDRSISALEGRRGVDKRQYLMKIHQASDSDPSFSSTTYDEGEGKIRSRTVSSAALLDSRTERSVAVGKVESELKRRHINKATGEPDHEVMDDDEFSLPKSKSVPAPLHWPNPVSVEVLQQMAHWNKMVAYLNMALLFFLLLLIVALVICVNYVWLVYQMPSSPGSNGGSLDYLAAGPMA